MISLRPLSDELQRKANEELNEDAARIEDDLKHIRDWLSKQPHLNARQDDQSLVNFGRGCKWSLQRMKEKIENFYTFRTIVPEYFNDRDPFSPDIQRMLTAGFICPLPNKAGPTAPRIVLFNYQNVENIPNVFVTANKVTFMTLDILMQEDDFIISGTDAIADYKHFTFSLLAHYSPGLLMKQMEIMQSAYPVRFKRYVAINVTSAFDSLFNMIKPFLSEKLKSRMVMVSEDNIYKAYKHMDKSLFPIEYGGENGSLPDLIKQWKLKVESYRDWFLEDAQYKSRENLRIGKSKCKYNEEGMDGSFRKLTID